MYNDGTSGKKRYSMGHEHGCIPVSSGLPDEIAKELKAYGFQYREQKQPIPVCGPAGLSTIMRRTIPVSGRSMNIILLSGEGGVWRNDPTGTD